MGGESLGFIYGIVLYNCYVKYNKWIINKYFYKCIILFFASLFFGLLYLKVKPIYFFGDYIVKIILGICILLFMLQITGKFKIGNKVNMFLGKISYEIYLLHTVIFTFLNIIIEQFSLKINSGIYIILSIVITIFVSYIIYNLTNYILNKINFNNK